MMLRMDPGRVWKPLGRNPLHPRVAFPSLWGVNDLLQLLGGRAWAHHSQRAPAEGPPNAVLPLKPTITMAPACLCHRFAEQAVFALFCMFAILLFSRDPKFIPGWASFFAPG